MYVDNGTKRDPPYAHPEQAAGEASAGKPWAVRRNLDLLGHVSLQCTECQCERVLTFIIHLCISQCRVLLNARHDRDRDR